MDRSLESLPMGRVVCKHTSTKDIMRVNSESTRGDHRLDKALRFVTRLGQIAGALE